MEERERIRSVELVKEQESTYHSVWLTTTANPLSKCAVPYCNIKTRYSADWNQACH